MKTNHGNELLSESANTARRRELMKAYSAFLAAGGRFEQLAQESGIPVDLEYMNAEEICLLMQWTEQELSEIYGLT